MAAAAPPDGGPAARLLDFSQPMDVALLDATVAAFYGAGSNEEVREERTRRRARRARERGSEPTARHAHGPRPAPPRLRVGHARSTGG